MARAAVLGSAAVVSLAIAGSALALTVTAFSPNSGLPNMGACRGGNVTLTGTGFAWDGPASALSVNFGGGPNTDTIANGGLIFGSDTTLFAIVPNGAITGPITVTDAAGSAEANNGATFYVNPCPAVLLPPAREVPYTPGPAIASVKPTSGKAGAKVVIKGSDFFAVSAITIGGVKAKVWSHEPTGTSLTLTISKSAKSGPIDVYYSFPSCTNGDAYDNACGLSIPLFPRAYVEVWGGSKPKIFKILK